MRLDRAGRPVIGVQFNGQGPFDMVLDTAAQSSVITAALAQELRLQPLPGESISVQGVSGSAQVALYPVDELKTDLFQAQFVALPGLPNAGSTSARGILGVEHFAQGKLGFDHREGRLTFSASSPVTAGSAAIQGRLDELGLLHVPLSIDGVAVDALVDTGASTSVANWAVVAALGWRRDDPRLKAAGGIRGATQAVSSVMSTHVDRFKIGPATLSNVPILVTAPAGAREEKPHLILGIDLLAVLGTYAVDFPRAELQIGVPR
ncbi:retroviral-like aspartic protease family protein [Pelomonas cellulosilytica]|uniref:Aspartyl protease family protein n=1 Tax=Pelomonas cellulosilytica TaxID=2906762 RepID=A0ABS8XZA3_9BURK|nr:retroviral-like aspartic protease family protein [Pelomonas sp. P8]MCE4557951.1 aspartyl protease family protein [Pelomonas sp. P8]